MANKSQARLLRGKNSIQPEQTGVVETPKFRWKVVAQIGVAFAVLWTTALATTPYFKFWGVGAMGVLTLVAFGFGIYIWRLTRKSQAIAQLLQSAGTAEGRKQALEQLDQGDSKDALNALAKAQLVAAENPQQAVTILEGVDLKKAPMMVQDDIRANLALLYLSTNRVKDARALTDDLRLDRQPNPKAKALYAAVMAEAQARTGAAVEAKKLLETFPADDADYGEMRALLRRAQVYTFVASKNRGLAKQAMSELANMDPNMLGAFLQKGVAPEFHRLAREVLAGTGLAPKVKLKTRMG